MTPEQRLNRLLQYFALRWLFTILILFQLWSIIGAVFWFVITAVLAIILIDVIINGVSRRDGVLD